MVALGGAVGAMLRWALDVGAQRAAGDPHFPVGTLLVNVIGCVAIGALAAWFTATPAGSPAEHVGRFALRITEPLHLFLFVGLLGGFTTFSSFALDALAMVETGERARALAYIVASNGLGVIGAWLAYWGVERVVASAG